MSVAKRLHNMGKKKDMTLIAKDAELVGEYHVFQSVGC